jgi:hypothetical protein
LLGVDLSRAKLELEFACRNYAGGVKVTVGVSCYLTLLELKDTCRVSIDLAYAHHQS